MQEITYITLEDIGSFSEMITFFGDTGAPPEPHRSTLHFFRNDYLFWGHRSPKAAASRTSV